MSDRFDVALMIEGQDGLNWPRWRGLADTAERAGFAGLYRSDHFTNSTGPHLDALELWSSLTWLASHSRGLEFGPLVSPVSFRHPVITAWTAAAADDLSGGRLQLGMGAGWQEREHAEFGFDLLDVDARFRRFREALIVVTLLLRGHGAATFDGEFYHLHGAELLPRPERPGGPPIVIGGNGPRRTLPLVAEFADEWNGTFQTPEHFAALSRRLDALLEARGRNPASVRRTLMTRVIFGRDDAEAARKTEGESLAALREDGVIVGTAGEVVTHL
ncbi:MAG TPA: TIGR03560 family F420-dependent LLM class oxidoreductase, partial [Thermomicrobiales bacterium]|nr:TIGR03560 family F420-dependent LLM class oxidoreductase [Thermomicrobiales bacterium]